MDLQLEQVLTQVVAFLVTFFVLKKFAWKPIVETMEKRKALIEGEFDAIAKEKIELDNLSLEYQHKLDELDKVARDKMVTAIEESKKIAAAIEDTAKEQAKRTMEKSREATERDVAQAKIELKNDLVLMAILIAEKILEEKLDSKSQQKLIEHAVKQVENL